MIFNRHEKLEGLHAPFGASKSSWLRYDDGKAIEVFNNLRAAEQGTILHEWAKTTILLRMRQPRSKKTIYSYINDAIGFNMEPEVVLYYSDNFFGTTDTICFRNKFLRIHDLKNGVTPAKMEQLEVYAALFCLEYKVDPHEIEMELRIYQNDEILVANPTGDQIAEIMDKIVHLDNVIKQNEGRI